MVDNCDVGYMLGMAANEDKVVAEATEELGEKNCSRYELFRN